MHFMTSDDFNIIEGYRIIDATNVSCAYENKSYHHLEVQSPQPKINNIMYMAILT